MQPGTDYLGKLHAAGKVLRVEGTTPYAKFLKGEIPVWISYENDGLKAKHIDGMGDAVAVVIPKEAGVAAPYAISLVKNGPEPKCRQAVAQLHHERDGPSRCSRKASCALRCRARRCPPMSRPRCRPRRRSTRSTW